MLSTQNLLSPADGEPVVAPTLDMVLGCYYLTLRASPAREGEGQAAFANAKPRRSWSSSSDTSMCRR